MFITQKSQKIFVSKVKFLWQSVKNLFQMFDKFKLSIFSFLDINFYGFK